MEKPSKKFKSYSDEREFSGFGNFSIGFVYLPDEIIEKIFGYLSICDLFEVQRVCSKWNEISRTPMFWKKVDLNIEIDRRPKNSEIYKLIEAFPSCVTHFRLHNGKYINGKICLTEILSKLQERCPNLEVLILDNAKLEFCPENPFPSILASLQQLRVLALRHSIFEFGHYFYDINLCNSNIEILDIARSYEMSKKALVLASMLPHLQELRLSGCTLVDRDFEGLYDIIKRLRVLDLEGTLINTVTCFEIANNGQHLTELYLCGTQIQDSDIDHQPANSFPKLETICIRGTYVTEDGIKLLMRRCRNLKFIYTSSNVSDEVLAEFFNSPSKKLHYDSSYIYCDHFMKKNYMLEH